MLSVGAIDLGDYVIGVRQLIAAVEFGTNELPVLPVASVALDFVALQRSGTVQGLVVLMPAAAKLTGEGGFFFDVHFVLHGVYFTTVSGFVKGQSDFFYFFLLGQLPAQFEQTKLNL